MAIDPTLPIPVHFQLKTLLIEAILEGDYGLDGRLPTEHQLCERHGISRTPVTRALGEWLSNPGVLHLGFADIRLTNLVLIVPAFWAFTGFGVITLTAGLTAVPYQLVEAAKVDGANAWQAARHILVPALRRPLVVVGVVSVIFALRTFDIVYVMTGGGPAQDTMVLALLLWQQAFAFLDTPKAARPPLSRCSCRWCSSRAPTPTCGN
jgi:Binding-protein-dependent transport system inner membrane component/Bacterial regulatory proteins, gntR family